MIDPRVPFLKLQMTQATSSSPPSSPSTSPSMVELREYFECPICLSVPRAPPIFQVQRCTLPLMPMKFHRIVFQCLSGHLICSECRPQINVCPICRASLGSNRQVLQQKTSLFIVSFTRKFGEPSLVVSYPLLPQSAGVRRAVAGGAHRVAVPLLRLRLHRGAPEP